MAKLTTTDLTSLTSNEASAVSTINSNFAAVETAMENTLSRDGTTPNTMSADIDMNSNDLLNVNAIAAQSITIAGNVIPVPGGLAIDDLNDVVITAAATGDIIRYNGTNWVDYPDSNYASSGHTHAIDDLSDVTISLVASGNLLRYNGSTWVNYADSNFAAASHGHAIADVTNLQTTLDGKSSTSHTHTVDDLSDVTITAAASGDILRYNGSAWVDYPDSNFASSGHNHTLDSLSNVTITAAATGDILRWNGSAWVDYADSNFAAASHTHASTDISDFAEAVQDVMGTAIVAGANVTVTYSDVGNTITIASSSGSGATNINDLGDVVITAAATGDIIRYDGSNWVDYPDSNYVKGATSSDLTVGYTTTSYNAGTKSSGTFTPDIINGAMQYAVNGGAHTLAPPSPGAGKAVSMCIQYTNNGSAGTITTSGFTKVGGDTLTTTNGDDFFFFITVNNGFSHLNVVALQ